MFQYPQPFTHDFNWKDLVERGDVVKFRFPVADEIAPGEQPKLRPCLLLDVIERNGETFVELAYGTSSDGCANRGYEVLVKQAVSRAAAGLDKPTRFVCARRVIVHIDHQGFECDDEDFGPLLGRLDKPLLERMNGVRARIQAEADIAADMREERRREQVRWAIEDRGFR